MGNTGSDSTALTTVTQRHTHWFTWRHLRCKAEEIQYPQGWTVLRLDIIAARDTPDPLTIADAILDRLVHNAHRLNLKGESIRKTAARRLGLDDKSAA
jgi:hypothetical protein